MRVLITGATGFVGSHLLEEYVSRDARIYATKKFRSDMSNVEDICGDITLLDMDITDAHSVDKAVRAARPEIIHHLAAQSFVPASWSYPTETFQTNALGTLNLFEAVKKNCPEAVIHIASSSEVYGIPATLPITENMIPNPVSPYGVSKLAMDRLGYQYYKSYDLKIVVTRAFNHTGPRRGDAFVCSSFAKQIAEIEKGKRERLYVGNLDAIRDFTDVRDICKAYCLAVKSCKFGEPYNICSGKSSSIQQILDRLISMSKSEIKVEPDFYRMRPSDLTVLEGDCTKFRKQTGWGPQREFVGTLEDLLLYWREKVKK